MIAVLHLCITAGSLPSSSILARHRIFDWILFRSCNIFFAGCNTGNTCSSRPIYCVPTSFSSLSPTPPPPDALRSPTSNVTMVALFRRPASLASALFTFRRAAAFSAATASPAAAFACKNFGSRRNFSSKLMAGSLEIAQFPCLSDNYG